MKKILSKDKDYNLAVSRATDMETNIDIAKKKIAELKEKFEKLKNKSKRLKFKGSDCSRGYSRRFRDEGGRKY